MSLLLLALSLLSWDAGDARKAVRQVLDAQEAAWNKGDLQGFMAGYWNSDDMVFFSGTEVTKGWRSTYERFQKRYQTEGREMGKLTFAEIEIDLLGQDSAYVRGKWQLVRSKDKVGGLFTLILKRLPDGWRIIHDHTSG